MARSSNRDRVGKALELLRDGLYPYIEREMKSKYGERWILAATPFVSENNSRGIPVAQMLKEDVAELLKVMWGQWNEVFRNSLGRSERSIVSELRDTRNSWAHGSSFTTDDAYRTFDSIDRLLTAVSAPEAQEINTQKQELLRQRFERQARDETRKAAVSAIESNPQGGLMSWRDIMTPHPDVASGRYQQAEFAADLWQVYLDDKNCAEEYRDPKEFFRRTYLTEGLQQLLTNALIRLSGNGGDPVIELQTNFGGGKTHAMLALYHLFFGVSAQDLPGTEGVFTLAKVSEPPKAVNTAVLVGNKISPGKVHRKKDGTKIHTLWGELAYQLGGKEGYEMVREADETATNPGDILKELFNQYSPCLILIDEWVAYARQLHYDQKDLPAGDFDTHFTFAQTLSESAKNADRTLLVVSIPASDIEIGGERGKEALDRLKNAIGRVESPWRPASAEESFQIVRRRLFQGISDSKLFVARDAVVRAFSEMYRQQSAEFPSECREATYERRLADAYPIHPELFDRLYSDWSTLDKFQRTRGVLRLMAKVIQTLWEQHDQSLMILPANVPMADSQVQSELTRYLEDSWLPVIDKDVDGVNSLPLLLDNQNPNLGRYSACRRVTRTIYMGSAPLQKAANLGIEDRRIKLGCVQPGESVATFGDALRRLTDQATYIYVDNNRYWISTQPNVTRTAQDRASQIERETERITEEIVRRLRSDKQRGDFAGVHIAPKSSADIPDEETMGVRLVVLSPQYAHSNKAEDSPARQEVAEILNSKGASPRYCKNLLTFLAPDKTKLANLQQWVCQYLAWDSIVQEKEVLNLDAFQNKQAATKCKDANETVDRLIQDTYEWLLVPMQFDPQGEVTWDESRLKGQDSPVLLASQKLKHEEHLIANYAATRLSLEFLNPYVWQNTNHIDLKTLWKYFTNYLYLPRLKNEQVLLDAIASGVAILTWMDNFAYATGWDEAQERYLGLKAGEGIIPSLSHHNLLVKPDVAQAQLQQERAVETPVTPPEPPSGGVPEPEMPTVPGKTHPVTPSAPSKRFYGSTHLDPLRVTRDAREITDEVLQHLTSLVGAEVEVTLEISIKVPDGIPENVIRTVTENCRTLKFTNHEFETE